MCPNHTFCITAVDLHLLQNALNVVTGIDLAVSRSAIPIKVSMYVLLEYNISSHCVSMAVHILITYFSEEDEEMDIDGDGSFIPNTQ